MTIKVCLQIMIKRVFQNKMLASHKQTILAPLFLYMHPNIGNFIELKFHNIFIVGFPDYSDAQELIPERPLQKTSAK